MAKSSPTYGPKDRIEHSVFGIGTIVESNERHTTIAFDQTGTRKFVTSMVKLEPSDAPAPARPVRKKKTAPKTEEEKEKAAAKKKKAATKKAAAKKAPAKKATTKKAAKSKSKSK